MRRAVVLAARGQGRPHPNPLVGAVLLDAAGATVGEGWHTRDRLGAPHAEVVALRARRGRGPRRDDGHHARAVRAHRGRSGPVHRCAGRRRCAPGRLRRRRPQPARRRGSRRLRAAGVEVESGVEEDLAERGNEAWLTSVGPAGPSSRSSYATTLDGRVAAADGTSRWITSPESRADVHRLRAGVRRDRRRRSAPSSPTTRISRSGSRTAPSRPASRSRVVIDAAGSLAVDRTGPRRCRPDSRDHDAGRLGPAGRPRPQGRRRPGCRRLVRPGRPRRRAGVLLARDVVHLLVEGGPAACRRRSSTPTWSTGSSPTSRRP